jgi:hypothetical protein
MTHLIDGDHKMDDDGSVWIEVRGFAVHILTTDEGIVVDVFNRSELADRCYVSPIASTYAYDHELTDSAAE